MADIICEVAHEQVMASSGEFTDPMDKNVKENRHKENFKTCLNCGDRNMPRHNRLCRACNTTITAARFKAAEQLQKTLDEAKEHQLSEVRVHIHKHDDAHYSVSYENQEEDLQSPYAHLGNHHSKDPTEIHMGELIFINPCSFDALAVILRDTGRQAGIRRYGGTHESLAMMCDGLPYTLGLQLIERFVQCNICGQHFDGIDDATTHVIKKHPTSNKVSFSKEFDGALLQPGPGHVEMNKDTCE